MLLIAPCLIIWGKEDKLIPIKYYEMLILKNNINDLQPEQKIVNHSDILKLENELSLHRPDKVGQQRHSVYSIIKSHHNYTIPLNTWIQLGFQY